MPQPAQAEDEDGESLTFKTMMFMITLLVFFSFATGVFVGCKCRSRADSSVGPVRRPEDASDPVSGVAVGGTGPVPNAVVVAQVPVAVGEIHMTQHGNRYHQNAYCRGLVTRNTAPVFSRTPCRICCDV